MKRVAICCAVLATLALAAYTQEAERKDETKYDRLKDLTTVSYRLHAGEQTDIDIVAEYRGQGRPRGATFKLSFSRAGAVAPQSFRGARMLYLMTDTARMELPASPTPAADEAPRAAAGLFAEGAQSTITPAALAKLAVAKALALELGSAEYDLTEDETGALRAFIARYGPPAKGRPHK